MIYAVNKRTKEHRIFSGTFDLPNGRWEFIQSEPDGWIPWEGGEPKVPPLPSDAPVECRVRVGTEAIYRRASKAWWHHDDVPTDVVAYRPILDAKPEAPAWDGGPPPVGSRGLDNDGDIVEVVAHHAGHAVCYMMDYAGYQYVETPYEEIRPIRSERDECLGHRDDWPDSRRASPWLSIRRWLSQTGAWQCVTHTSS